MTGKLGPCMLIALFVHTHKHVCMSNHPPLAYNPEHCTGKKNSFGHICCKQLRGKTCLENQTALCSSDLCQHAAERGHAGNMVRWRVPSWGFFSPRLARRCEDSCCCRAGSCPVHPGPGSTHLVSVGSKETGLCCLWDWGWGERAPREDPVHTVLPLLLKPTGFLPPPRPDCIQLLQRPPCGTVCSISWWQ